MHQGGSSKRAALPPADGSGCSSIEDMPDGILEHILGFLPAPESVRTCVLARRWRHLWRFATGMRVESEEVYEVPVKECREFMDRVLLDGESPLDTCVFKLSYFKEEVPLVNQWIRHAVMRKVRVLTLDVSSLEEAPTPYLELDDQPLASQHLTRLDLCFVHARNSFLDFSSCPSLKDLVLEYCELWSVTKISSKSLKYLTIVSCSIVASASGHSRLRIYAPHLVSLNIDCIEGRTPVLDSMPSLVEAFVRMRYNCEDTCDKLRDPNYSQCGCEYCTTSDNVGDDNCCVLLKGLSEAEDLQLISLPEMFIFKMDLRLCPTFSELKTLCLNEYWCMPDDFTPLTCILEHSPVLEELTLELFYGGHPEYVEMEGRFSVERPTTISEHLNVVKVKCEDVDKRVLKVLKFLCTFNIRFSF